VWQQGSLGLAGAIEGNSAFVRNSTQTNTDNPTVYQGPTANNPIAPIDVSLKSVYGFDRVGLLGEVHRPETWRLNSIENYVRYDVATMVEGYRRSGASQPIGKVILGCTHFSFEAARIQENLQRLRVYRDSDGNQPYHTLINEDVSLIDPGQQTAKQTYRQLFLNRLLVRGEAKQPPAVERIFVSVPAATVSSKALTPDGGLAHDYKYGRAAGDFDNEETRFVPMTRQLMPAYLVDLVRKHCPSTWGQIKVQ
jgi:hypothetical protein